jgi:hypothetical protein
MEQMNTNTEDVQTETSVQTEAAAPVKGDYAGTEDSRFGKIVVVKELAEVGGDHDGSWGVVAQGPQDKGFASSADAVEWIKERCQADFDADLDPLPSYQVVRLVKRVSPRKVQKTVLDFDE